MPNLQTLVEMPFWGWLVACAGFIYLCALIRKTYYDSCIARLNLRELQGGQPEQPQDNEEIRPLFSPVEMAVVFVITGILAVDAGRVGASSDLATNGTVRRILTDVVLIATLWSTYMLLVATRFVNVLAEITTEGQRAIVEAFAIAVREFLGTNDRAESPTSESLNAIEPKD